MSKLTVHIDEAQTQLRDLLERAARGEEVVIQSDNQNSFRLILVEAPQLEPAANAGQRVAGLNRGSGFWMSDDFNDELPDEFWLGDERDDPLYW